MNTIEIKYEGPIHPEVVTYLNKDLGLLIEQTRPLIVRSAGIDLDAGAALAVVRLIPGVRQVLVRAGSTVESLRACDAGC